MGTGHWAPDRRPPEPQGEPPWFLGFIIYNILLQHFLDHFLHKFLVHTCSQSWSHCWVTLSQSWSQPHYPSGRGTEPCQLQLLRILVANQFHKKKTTMVQVNVCSLRLAPTMAKAKAAEYLGSSGIHFWENILLVLVLKIINEAKSNHWKSWRVFWMNLGTSALGTLGTGHFLWVGTLNLWFALLGSYGGHWLKWLKRICTLAFGACWNRLASFQTKALPRPRRGSQCGGLARKSVCGTVSW